MIISHILTRGGFSHWHGIRICACLLGALFREIWYSDRGGFHHRRRSPNYINSVYFGQIIVKSTQFDPNWVLFFRKWYTDGWEIWQKIGIEIVIFSRSGRHIHVRFWWKNPPPPGILTHFNSKTLFIQMYTPLNTGFLDWSPETLIGDKYIKKHYWSPTIPWECIGPTKELWFFWFNNITSQLVILQLTCQARNQNTHR